MYRLPNSSYLFCIRVITIRGNSIHLFPFFWKASTIMSTRNLNQISHDRNSSFKGKDAKVSRRIRSRFIRKNGTNDRDSINRTNFTILSGSFLTTRTKLTVTLRTNPREVDSRSRTVTTFRLVDRFLHYQVSIRIITGRFTTNILVRRYHPSSTKFAIVGKHRNVVWVNSVTITRNIRAFRNLIRVDHYVSGKCNGTIILTIFRRLLILRHFQYRHSSLSSVNVKFRPKGVDHLSVFFNLKAFVNQTSR